MIDWNKASIIDYKIAKAICSRATTEYPCLDAKSLQMDIVATHISGCKLKLKALLAADDFNFFHDVLGIRTHLDRETGELQNCFLPRFAV